MMSLVTRLLVILMMFAMFPSDGSSSNATTGPSVSRYGVFEYTITYPTAAMGNPWEDGAVTATFTAPSGAKLRVDGFYYDTNTYKVRFTPAQVGAYFYSGAISGPSGQRSFSGSFESVPSTSHGFIRRVSESTSKLQFEDGTYFAGAGLNDCWVSTPTSLKAQSGIIGDASIEPTGEYGPVPLDAYFSKYGDGGGRFNLFRWNPANCSYNIYKTISTHGNTYLVTEGQAGDVLLATAKKHGFHIMFTFFKSVPYMQAKEGTPEADALKKYISYAVARYGAYVDVWEMTNESKDEWLSDAWMTWTTSYVRSIDPYHRLVTNSYPRPNDSDYLDIQSPHSYGTENLYPSRNQSSGLPVLVGENGAAKGTIASSAAYQQDFQRTQLWTAVFGGTGIIWWNSSWKYPQPINMYLGSKARLTNRVLQSLVAGLDATAVSSQLNANGANAYGLTCPHEVLAYVTRLTGQHDSASTTVMVSVPFNVGSAAWVDPSTGTTLQTFELIGPGSHRLTTPTFTDDVALKVVDALQLAAAPCQ